jgi:beta-lactamase class A
MLQESDNVATDVLIEWSGGIQTVRRRVIEMGFGTLAPQRSILHLLSDLYGLSKPPSLREEWWRERRRLSAAARSAALRQFLDDPRDQAPPLALCEFLKAIWLGKVLEEPFRVLFFDILSRCQTGQDRLKAGLPKGTWVAHKTASFVGAYCADSGVARLPNGNHVAMSAHVHLTEERSCIDIARFAAYASSHFS